MSSFSGAPPRDESHVKSGCSIRCRDVLCISAACGSSLDPDYFLSPLAGVFVAQAMSPHVAPRVSNTSLLAWVWVSGLGRED